MPLSPVHRRILPIALPSVLMNISLPLLGAVDTAVVGHLGGVYFVGAVGIGSLVFSVLYWAFGFLRMGVIGLTAQSYGRGEREECAAILWRGLLIAVVLGGVMIVARHSIAWAALGLIDASAEVEHHARTYILIRILAAPAVFVGMVFTGWFYGMHRIALPVTVLVGVNALNVALDLLFVMRLGFDSDGVAWATVIAQYAGLLAMLIAFRVFFRDCGSRLIRPGVFDRGKLTALLTMNTNLFVRTASLLAAQSYFLARSATHGDSVLAANTILTQFRHITSYGLDGFATAAEVVVGTTLGDGQEAAHRQAIRLCLIYGMSVGAGFSLAYLSLHTWLLPLFTEDPEVLALATRYVIWIIVEPLVSNICFILDGIFIGATATRTMRNAMLFSVFAVYFPLFLWMEPAFGNHGMWGATLALYAVRGLTLGWPLARRMRSGQSAAE